jgi:nucleoside-diphosphate-sugar epimerase
MSSNLNVLITGVAGMIGSHLLDRLLVEETVSTVYGIDDLSVGKVQNIDSAIIDRKFTFLQGDILDADFLNTIPPVDIVVHLAAAKKIGEENPGVENLHINGIGTENILKLAMKNKSKVILGSTSDCYGMSADLPFREDGDLLIGPSMIKRWSYAVGKLYAEQLAFAYFKDFGLPIVVLRYFGGFSERASFTWSSGHIPLFIDWILKDEECVIHGDGEQTRSMTHVANLVDATYSAMFNEKAVGELINIGDNKELSVIESAKLIHEQANTGNDLKLKFIDTSTIFGTYKDIQRRCPDLTKAKKILNYKPIISMEEGLLKVINTRKGLLGIEL